MTSRIDAVLHRARTQLSRLPADEVPAALARGALLVDIRPAAQRAREGEVPGSLIVERNVLEWRFDPASDARLPEATGYDEYDRKLIAAVRDWRFRPYAVNGQTYAVCSTAEFLYVPR